MLKDVIVRVLAQRGPALLHELTAMVSALPTIPALVLRRLDDLALDARPTVLVPAAVVAKEVGQARLRLGIRLIMNLLAQARP